MRRIVVAAALACTRIAMADDKAVDGPVLEAARKAGYPSPRVIARGGFSVVAQDGMEGKPGKVLVVGPGGVPVRELGALAGGDFGIANATIGTFLGRQDLADVLVTSGAEPLAMPSATHYLVRAASLEIACVFAGSTDSGAMLKAQRFSTTVSVKRLAGKDFAFEVTTKDVQEQDGRTVRRHAIAKRYTLADTGSCTEIAK